MTKQRSMNNVDENSVARLELAFKLRAQRCTYEVIAQKCGYANRASAHNAIKNALKKRIETSVDEYRQQELEFLDMVHQKIWPMVFDRPNPDLWAVDRMLQVSRDRRALLNLDVPKDVQMNIAIPVVREVAPGYLKLEKGDGNASIS